MHSMPCQRLNTSGYFLVSVLNLMVPSTCRSTLSSRWIAPVRKLPPAGTTTCPPPALVQAATALAKAVVQSVLPSPLAPYAVMSKFWFGKVGGLIRPRITGTWSHADAFGTARPEPVVVNARAGSTSRPAVAAAPARIPPAFSRSRRECCLMRGAPFMDPFIDDRATVARRAWRGAPPDFGDVSNRWLSFIRHIDVSQDFSDHRRGDPPYPYPGTE